MTCTPACLCRGRQPMCGCRDPQTPGVAEDLGKAEATPGTTSG